MTLTADRTAVRTAAATVSRTSTHRTYVMCRPSHFTVRYSINPWMNPAEPVDQERAMQQWNELRETYERLGHAVHQVHPRPGLPDMVFAANGGFAVGRQALGARFREDVRSGEEPCYRARLELMGIDVVPPVARNEGEGDFVWAYGSILAASGFRTDVAAQVELEATFDAPVHGLELVDPRFYHLDTALAVLDRDTVAYYPAAFSAQSRIWLAERYPDAIVATEADALVLGLNLVSDGRNVVIAEQAVDLRRAVAARGFVPVPVDVSEFLKAGGGIKCCTLELHGYSDGVPPLD